MLRRAMLCNNKTQQCLGFTLSSLSSDNVRGLKKAESRSLRWNVDRLTPLLWLSRVSGVCAGTWHMAHAGPVCAVQVSHV